MPLPGQTPEGPEGKYSPVQMAEWLMTEAASFKDPQELLAEIERQGFSMTPSEGGPMGDPMGDPMMGEEPPMEEPPMEEPPMEEPPMDEGEGKGKGAKGPAFLEIMRIGAAEKAIGKDKDKKAKKKAEDEEEGY